MNPILQEAVGSILRWGLTIIAGWAVSHGIWTASAAATYVTAGVLALLTLGWSLWQKYVARRKLVTALTMAPGTTEVQVEQKIASGTPVPTVTTPPDTVPGVPSTPSTVNRPVTGSS